MQLTLGGTTTFHIVSHNRAVGTAADLNAVPTIVVYPDEADAIAYSPAPVRIRDGHYRVSVAHTEDNGFARDTWYNIKAGGVDAVDTNVLDQIIIARFQLKALAWFGLQIGDSISMGFTTRIIATGMQSAADSAPTVEVFENDGDADIGGVTVTDHENGSYSAKTEATTGNTFEAGKSYNVVATATISGVTSRCVIGIFKLRPIVAADDIETALYSRLTGNAGVFALISGRVFPHVVPEKNSQFPCIVFERTDGEHIHSLRGSSGAAEATYQLACWATTYPAARELAEAVRNCLDGYSGTIGTLVVKSILLESDMDVAQIPPGKKQQIRWAIGTRYTCFYNETVPTLS